jgi:hypothetical protein
MVQIIFSQGFESGTYIFEDVAYFHKIHFIIVFPYYNYYFVSYHRNFLFLAFLFLNQWRNTLHRLAALSVLSALFLVWLFFVENLLNVFLITFPDVFNPSLKLSVVAMITDMTNHFIFHFRRISVHRFLYFNFFLAPLCVILLSCDISTSANFISLVVIY